VAAVRALVLSALVLGALAAAVTLAAAPATADQVLQAVRPGNGATLEHAPDEVVLTFAEPLDGTTVSVTVTTPEGRQDVEPTVAGRDVTVPVEDGGPGQYVLAYALEPGPAQGETGFTVLAPGESPPVEQPTSPWWSVAGVALVAGLVAAVVGTVLRWRRS
jgi:methionine-rich copper-binding protein CopC